MARKGGFPNYPLAELHAHLGSSVSPVVLWQIAHDLGIKLPKRDFGEFNDYIMLSPERRVELNEYFRKVYHPILDKLSSGTHAVEQATYRCLSGAYHSGGISLIELRNNPMRHNNNAQLDLDHIILAMLRGMERALLEHKRLRAGLIFCMDRLAGLQQNSIILEKAIKYHKRGVIGIDVAGPASGNFKIANYAGLFRRAKAAGLKVTVHSGEVAAADDMWEALEYASPDRIGHGIRAAYDKSLMKELAARRIVLEVCPLSNIATKAVESMEEMKWILRSFIEHKVKFCINTDWPEVIVDGHLRQQYQLLYEKGILSEEELYECIQTARSASFIPKGSGVQLYL